MRKKILYLVSSFFLVSFFLFGCSQRQNNAVEKEMSNSVFVEAVEEVEKEDVIQNNETQKDTPSTITDLFSGEPRIWYYISSTDELAYDGEIKAIFVSENKTITEIYYNLRSYKCSLSETDFAETPNPFAERFELQDFDGLSYEQILEKVRRAYASADCTYDLNINGVYAQYGALSFDYNKYSSFDAIKLPFEITYDGELDSTGNEYEEETIYLFDDASIVAYFYFNQSAEGESLKKEFTISDIIEPTLIKNKEYVGIIDRSGNMLITENTYASFEDIGYDKVEDSKGLAEEELKQEVNVEIEYIDALPYSEGLALLCSGGTSYSFVDKLGKIQIKINTESQARVTSFSNGYAYIIMDNKYTTSNVRLAIIDKEGTLRSSYVSNSTREILAYGDGFVLTQEYVSGFDEAYYIIKFFDADGHVLEERKLDHAIRAKHLGKGNFYIWDYEYNFYCANNNKWTLFEVGKDAQFVDEKFSNVKFYQDVAVLGMLINLNDGSQDGLCLIDADGNIKNISINSEIVGDPWYTVEPIINNYCIFYGGDDDNIFLYDLSSDTLKPLDKYLDKVDWENIGSGEILVGNARIAIPMIGSDGNNYISIFDTEWNMIGNPIAMGKYANVRSGIYGNPYFGFKDDRLVVKSEYTHNGANVYKIYDENGEIVFEVNLADYGVAEHIVTSDSYSEGALLICISNGIPRYVDVNGNLLFESVDDSEAVKVAF